MIIVKLQGGLGNQMFQYAMLRSLCLRYKERGFVDLKFLHTHQLPTPSFTPRNFELGVFKIKADDASVLSFNGNLHHYTDLSNFDLIQLPAYLDGYFQSENFFKQYSNDIITDFEFMSTLDERNTLLMQQIKSSNSVSIHFRRGDYVNNAVTSSVHGVCSIQYYDTAIKHIIESTTEPFFYVFTDDPYWVQKNFFSNYAKYKMVLVDINNESESWKDMQLMSCCKHNIIANSTFSWWGAWLNQNPNKKVISPAKWTKAVLPELSNIIPEKWIKINCPTVLY